MIFFSSDKDFKKFYEKLTSFGNNISLLVSESPKKVGRRKIIAPNPAHEFAKSINLKTVTPNTLVIPSFERQIEKALLCDDDKFGFIFSYGKIIPLSVINCFEKGILNIHFSYLPEYPGASPIQQAILDNEKKIGYTIFKITNKLDDGDILHREKITIKQNDTYDDLRDRIIDIALDKLPDILDRYRQNPVKLKKMPGALGQLTRKFTKSDGQIGRSDNAQEAYNKIKAFSRWPKVFFVIDNRRIIVHKAHMEDNLIKIDILQVEGKKPTNFKEFTNGYRSLLTKMPKFVKIN